MLKILSTTLLNQMTDLPSSEKLTGLSAYGFTVIGQPSNCATSSFVTSTDLG